MTLLARFNPLIGLILGLTLGGVVGLYVDNFGLGLVVGASVGLLLGRWCSNMVKARQGQG